MPDFDLPGVAVDPSVIASQLAEGADDLAGLLVEIDEAEKRADVTRDAKNAAIEAYDDKFLSVARVAESIFRYAGQPELATRVRPSTRRPGRRLADEGGQADSTGSADTTAAKMGASAAADRRRQRTADTSPRESSSLPSGCAPASGSSRKVVVQGPAVRHLSSLASSSVLDWLAPTALSGASRRLPAPPRRHARPVPPATPAGGPRTARTPLPPFPSPPDA